MKPLIAKNTGLVFLLAVLLTGCITPKVLTRHDIETNFSKYKSYSWLPFIDSSNKQKENDTVKQMAHHLITKELGRRGCVTDAVKPSFLVQVEFTLQEKEQANIQYFDYGGSYWYVVQTVKYIQSTVLVKMIDAETQKLVWQGWSSMRGNLRFEDAIKQIAIKLPVNYAELGQMQSRIN